MFCLPLYSYVIFSRARPRVKVACRRCGQNGEQNDVESCKGKCVIYAFMNNLEIDSWADNVLCFVIYLTCRLYHFRAWCDLDSAAFSAQVVLWLAKRWDLCFWRAFQLPYYGTMALNWVIFSLIYQFTYISEQHIVCVYKKKSTQHLSLSTLLTSAEFWRCLYSALDSNCVLTSPK